MSILAIILTAIALIVTLVLTSLYNGLFEDWIKKKAASYRKTAFFVFLTLIVTAATIAVLIAVNDKDKREGQKENQIVDNSSSNDTLKKNLPTSRRAVISDTPSTEADQKKENEKNEAGNQEKPPISKKSDPGADPAEIVKQLLLAETKVSSDKSSVEHVLSFFEFPIIKNFAYRNMTVEQLRSFYNRWFVQRLPYHKIADFENGITSKRMEDGGTRVEVNFTFETSPQADGSNKKVEKVFNAYIVNQRGKIESIGLGTDKNL